MPTATNTSTSNPALPETTSGLVPVPRHILRCLDVTPVNLYVRHDRGDDYVLFREAGYELSQDRAMEVAEVCGDALFVNVAEYSSLSEHLWDNLDEIVEEEALAPTERYEVLQTAVALEVEQAFRLVNCDKLVSTSLTIGRQLTSLMTQDGILAGELFRIARHDFNTFTHVTNVASYTVLLAEEIGISNRGELQKLAVGGLLHDVGKRFISNSILSKAGALTKEERAIIETHPQLGFEELHQREDLEFGQLMMVYQHHEHIDGAGYPVGVLGDEIHPWAKLLAVVDVFDALTGKRPYRRPTSRHDALGFLQSRCGSQFDGELVSCWVSAMNRK